VGFSSVKSDNPFHKQSDKQKTCHSICIAAVPAPIGLTGWKCPLLADQLIDSWGHQGGLADQLTDSRGQQGGLADQLIDSRDGPRSPTGPTGIGHTLLTLFL
jgi:hypothetical protein